jgi:hypothetical protein
MPQRRLAEGQQRQLNPGRVMLGRLRPATGVGSLISCYLIFFR